MCVSVCYVISWCGLLRWHLCSVRYLLLIGSVSVELVLLLLCGSGGVPVLGCGQISRCVLGPRMS